MADQSIETTQARVLCCRIARMANDLDRELLFNGDPGTDRDALEVLSLQVRRLREAVCLIGLFADTAAAKLDAGSTAWTARQADPVEWLLPPVYPRKATEADHAPSN